MKNRLIVFAVALLVLSAGVAAGQEFLPYEGKNAVQEGEGGTKKVVNGIDFWADGAPPRPFKLLGYISDRRHKTGIVGMIRMSSLENDVAELAKNNGGDAVILVASEAETVGTVGGNYGQAQGNANRIGGNTNFHASGWSSGASSAVQKQQSKYAVVKYIERGKPSAGDAQPTSNETSKPADEGDAPPAASSPPTN